ncbi:histidine kinase [Streptomyces sp. NPDC095613]|uniref:sensor histidine kinase n=1 Tax=Streptomyces sp. NPDC095613 TaxID=3155540 RepID=UPI00331D3AA9
MGKLFEDAPLSWTAVLVISGLQCGVALSALNQEMGTARGDLRLLLVALGTLVALLLLQSLHSAPAARRIHRPYVICTLTLQTALTYLPPLLVNLEWHGLGGFAAGSVLAVLRDRKGVAGLAMVAVCDWAACRYGGLSYVETTLSVLVTIAVGVGVATLIRTTCRLASVHRAEASAIRKALQEERMRIGRDMHDLLAARLTFAVLRGELASRHIGSEDERARSELRGVLKLTRGALSDLRSLAHSFGDFSLIGELDHARALLGGVGVSVTVHEATRIPPGETETVFAVAVRESVTNILRHSEARACCFLVYRRQNEYVLSVVNDGAELPPGPVEATHGHGLANLASRAASTGGTCTARCTPTGMFELTVVSPQRAPARTAVPIPLPGPGTSCKETPRRDDYAPRAG